LIKLSDLMKRDSSYTANINSVIRTAIDKRVASGDLCEFDDDKLKPSDSALVKLNGNPTTGYSWHCIIGDESILKLTSDNYLADSNDSGRWVSGVSIHGDSKP